MRLAPLTKAEINRRTAWVMLYRCVTENRKSAEGGEGGWPKGALDADAIAVMVADGYVEEFLGGWRLTSAGITEWERRLGAVTAEIKRADTNATRQGVLKTLWLLGGWVNARKLPGYIAHSSWSSLIRNKLWREGHVDKRSAHKGKEIEFRITPKGKEYAASIGIKIETEIETTTQELHHEPV